MIVLLAAPMSLYALLLGKIAVGAFFAIAVSAVALIAGLVFFNVPIAQPALLVAGIQWAHWHFSDGIDL